MPRFKKLPPEVELRPSGRIWIRPRVNKHFRFIEPDLPYNDKKISIRGKSSKELKNVIIPYYQNLLWDERHRVKMYREQINRIQGKCTAIINKIRRQNDVVLRTLAREQRKSFNEVMREKANKIIADKLNELTKRQLKTHEGAFAYPAIIEYARRNNIGTHEMVFVIILHLFEQVKARDLLTYGFKKIKINYKTLDSLVEKGYAEKFGKHPVSYIATVKTKKVMSSYLYFYKININNFINKDEYKRRANRWKLDE